MKIRTKFLLTQIISGLLMMITVTLIAISLITDRLHVMTEEELFIALKGYAGNVNYLRDTGKEIDITVFTGAERTESSIPGAVGSMASNVVIETVLNKGQTYFDTNVDVNGVSYCGYYIPTEDGMLFAGEPRAYLDSVRGDIATYLVIAAFAICVLTTGVVAIIVLRMSKRIEGASESMKQLANGNLTATITTYNDEKDETCLLSKNAQTLQTKLREIISSMQTNSEQVKKSSNAFRDNFKDIESTTDNISHAVDEIALGAGSLAEEAQNMTSQVNNMSSVVERSKEGVQSLEAAVTKMTSASGETEKLLGELSKLNEKNQKSIQSISTQTQATHASVEEIRNAVLMIQDIASQTNLLSLNASIEAARAGEAGRGFAVVADQIRGLAESSSQGAETIEHIIKELSRNSNEAVMLMNEVLNTSKAQEEGLQATEEVFYSLSKEISMVYNATEAIAEQVTSLSKSRNIVMEVTEGVSSVSEESAAASEETAAAVQTLTTTLTECSEGVHTLADMSEALEKEISFFTV